MYEQENSQMIQGKTDEELQPQLWETLKCYPNMHSYFEVMLNQRMTREDWLECPLIQLILNKRVGNLTLIEERLVTIRNYDRALLSSIREDEALAGNEKRFDERLRDHLSELHGAQWLIKDGFGEIGKLSTGKRKTPDFSALKGKAAYLIEVKNFRAPFELNNLLLDKYEARRLRYPDSYGRLGIGFELDSELKFRNSPEEDRKDADAIYKLIDEHIWGCSESYCEHIITYNGIKCKCKYPSPSAGWSSFRDALCFNSKYIFECLMPLAGKTWAKLERAMRQLFDYDENDDRNKLIMINWEKSANFIIDDDLQTGFEEIVKEFDRLLKIINPKLEVRLL